MSLEAMTWAWRQELPPNGKFVLIALADHASDDGTDAWPSVQLLARKVGYSARQVQRILAELTTSEVIRVQRPSTSSRPTTYALSMTAAFSIGRDDFQARSCPPDLRLEVIARDRFTCQLCRRRGDEILDPDGKPWEADRIAAGAHYVLDNVRLSCRSCNRARGEGRQDDAPSGDDRMTPGGTSPVTPGGVIPVVGGATTVTPEPSLNPPEPVVVPSEPLEPRRPTGALKRAHRLPDGWTPTSDVVAQMRSECPAIDQDLELRKFRDHWNAQGGQRGAKLDWPATYRNWIRNSSPPRGQVGPQPGYRQTPEQLRQDRLARAGDLTPPARLGGDPAAERAWLREARRRIADGLPLDDIGDAA